MRPMDDTIKLKVPKTIQENIAAKLQWDPPNWVKSANSDKFLYIVSKIISLTMNNRKYSRLKLVPLSSIVLRYEIGKHYRKYIDWLITHKFIESDNHYIVGSTDREGKCKCYGLTKTYKSKPLVDFELKNEFILKKILNWRKTKLSETISDPMMSRLYSMMDNFTVDMDGITSELEELRRNGNISQKQMDIELAKCQKINDKKESTADLFIVKDNYSRVHTNITNISRRVRENHLYIGGKKAIGIDIVSSQPALLHSLFQDYVNRIDKMPEYIKSSNFYIEFDDNRSDIRDKYRNKLNKYDGDTIYDHKSELSLSKLGFNTFEECCNRLKIELSRYAHALDCGLYEFFQDEWGKFWGDDISRNKMKTNWLTYVFGQGKSPDMHKLYCIWDYHYPTLNKLLKYFKIGDHKTLAHHLQRKEAELVYEKLCPAIDELMDIKYSTVHDSIIVEEDVVDEVRDVFTSILNDNNILTIAF